MTRDDYLFSTNDLSAVLDALERQLHQQIEAMDSDEFLNTSPEQLSEYYVAEYTVEVPVLQHDRITVDQEEDQLDVSQDRGRDIRDRQRAFHVPATRITHYIPFEGDGNLFTCQASTRSLNPPRGVIRDEELVLTHVRLDHDAESIKSDFDRELGKVQQQLHWIAGDVKLFNEALVAKIRSHIEARRTKLLADRELAASLGYPLRVRSNAPNTYSLPTKRRRPSVVRPRPRSDAPSKPEPALGSEDYEHILDVLSNMVQVIERSPHAFQGMKEEDLRHHFLVQLNGQYEGTATGETFNFEGKTDILVRVDGRNVFIAECKFWDGPKSLAAAVDQLLGYASWHDTKTAILVFNRGKNLSGVLAKIPNVVKAHSNFRRDDGSDGTRFRYTFTHRDDPNRELTITVLVFEVPSQETP